MRVILTDKDFVKKAELLLSVFHTSQVSDEKSPLKRWVCVFASVAMFLNYVKS